MFTSCNKRNNCKHDDPLQIVKVEAVPPTCLKTGLTEGLRCNLCETMVVPQLIVEALGHTEVTDEAVASTCTESGLTEGKHCAVCDTVFVAQQEISIIDCIETEWLIDVEATKTEDGVKHTECSMCGKRISEEAIPATGSLGLKYIKNTDNMSCTITGIGDCKDLMVVIPNVIDGYRVTSIGNSAFTHCTSITHVFIPISVTNIGEEAFRGCSSLRLVNIPNTITSIGNRAFYNCIELQAIAIPPSVTDIGDEAFLLCEKLTNIKVDVNNPNYQSVNGHLYTKDGKILVTYAIGKTDSSFIVPNSVTNIGESAFYNGIGLTSITIPNSLTSIGDYAFCGCSGMKSINYEGTVEQWNAITKGDSWNINTGSYTIYCTDGAISKDGTITYYEQEELYTRDGDYIYFGEYPQTIKADDVTITSTTDSCGYYLGSDGYYYAAVTATPNGSGYKFSTGATVTNGVVYYFKVEPIRWRILSEDGETAFILCDSIIDKQIYDDSSNNYAESKIRQWLNKTFYETAFTEIQREIILTTVVDNSAESTGCLYNPYACGNTEDKIFLLSYVEVISEEYNFVSNHKTEDTGRRMLTSDYSRATGVWMNTDSSCYGNSFWWLRSPISDDNERIWGVNFSGMLYNYYNSYDYAARGVVPALQIVL